MTGHCVGRIRIGASLIVAGLTLLAAGPAQAAITCQRQVTRRCRRVRQAADVQPARRGQRQRHDVRAEARRHQHQSQLPLTAGGSATPGNLDLRPDKRHRPLVLRVRGGDCLTVNFTNLLTPLPNPRNFLLNPPQVITPAGQIFTHRPRRADPGPRRELPRRRACSWSTTSTATAAGSAPTPPTALPPPAGGTKVYKLYAEKEGVFNVTGGGTFGSDGNRATPPTACSAR